MRHRGAGPRLPAAVRGDGPQGRGLRRRLHRRRLWPLHEGPRAHRLHGDAAAVAGLYAPREDRPLRIPRARPSGHARHAHADLGADADVALSGPRADEPGALCHRGLPSRQCAGVGSRPEIFCAGGALLGHAALWRLAALRLRGNRVARRHRDRHSGQAQYRRHLRPRVPAGGPLVQDVGGAIPHVDA